MSASVIENLFVLLVFLVLLCAGLGVAAYVCDRLERRFPVRPHQSNKENYK